MRRNKPESSNRLLRRLAKQSKVVVEGHLLNWPWRPKAERRKRRYAVTRKAVMRYLQLYGEKVGRFVPPQSEDEIAEPERVFTIWLQGEEQAPPLVKACFRSMRRNLKQELVILDDNSLSDWIELPDFIMEKWKSGKIKPAHFTDICRVELLYRHGGVWLDATDYVTAPIPDWIMDQDFFIYLTGDTVRETYSYVQNCFFRAKKHDPLLAVWRNAIHTYWQNEDSIVNYYTHQFLFKLAVENNPAAASRFVKMPKLLQDPTHELWFKHADNPFSEELYREATKDTFFQKTNYKSKSAVNPPEGSVAHRIINADK